VTNPGLLGTGIAYGRSRRVFFAAGAEATLTGTCGRVGVGLGNGEGATVGDGGKSAGCVGVPFDLDDFLTGGGCFFLPWPG
jgi:hypothetical protein